MNATKAKILDAAERLFGEHGYDATSLRAITSEAGVNLASVNYHFNSKEALLGAVVGRRLRPLNARRLALLEQFEAEAGGAPVPVEKVLYALVEPMLAPEMGLDQSGFKMLLARMYMEPAVTLRRLFGRELASTARRFVAAVSRSLPGVSHEDVLWRFFFVVGSMAFAIGATPVLDSLSRDGCDTSDSRATVERLVVFGAAGLRADAPRSARRKRRQVS
jgi:AcrR family transcriptional regulator